MATLRSQTEDRWFVPGPHSTVGRASSCDLVLEPKYVSGTHALLRWTGACWELRDLHSRNGTWIDGRQLQPGEALKLTPSAKVAFGSLDVIWTVTDVDPPRARAEAADGRVAYERDGLLVLPNRKSPEVQLYQRSDDVWLADRGHREDEIRDGGVVVADGVIWTVQLPRVVAHTAEPSLYPVTPATLVLRFLVSDDEEHIEIEFVTPATLAERRMSHRAHNHLLLALARARLAAGPEVSPSEQGWVYQEELMEQLAVDGNLLNMHLFRARQAFGAAEVLDAANIVERRRGSGQLRLGVAQVVIDRF